MKKYLVIIILLSCVLNLYSQVRFEIMELNLFHITLNLQRNVWIEGEEDGPYVEFKCAIYNQSDRDIRIIPLESAVVALFNYKDVDYERYVLDREFINIDSLIIKSHDKIEFDLGTRLLLGTSLLEEKKEDYSMTLLRLLPTLRVHFKDSNLNLFSSRIWKVNIK